MWQLQSNIEEQISAEMKDFISARDISRQKVKVCVLQNILHTTRKAVCNKEWW